MPPKSLRQCPTPRGTAQVCALPSLSHRASPGLGMEQVTPERMSHDNNGEADFWKIRPQLAAAGAFRQQVRMQGLLE